jgi:hypothetical protein
MLAANYPPPVLPIRGRGAVPGASVHRLSMENDLAQSVDDFSGDVLLGCPTSQLWIGGPFSLLQPCCCCCCCCCCPCV